MKAIAVILLSLCICLPCWAGQNGASVDSKLIQAQIQKAVGDLQIQIPELLKAVRVSVQSRDIQVKIPEIRVQLPEILVPAIYLQVPDVQIPEIQLPEIRIEIPKIDIQTHSLAR